MTFVQRRNRVTTHSSERIPVVKRRITVIGRNVDRVNVVSFWYRRYSLLRTLRTCC